MTSKEQLLADIDQLYSEQVGASDGDYELRLESIFSNVAIWYQEWMLSNCASTVELLKRFPDGVCTLTALRCSNPEISLAIGIALLGVKKLRYNIKVVTLEVEKSPVLQTQLVKAWE